ncbi:MAG: alpha/beta fold hydrolase [Candidatus Cyclobacteriaceae bacterium M2_1C_046]
MPDTIAYFEKGKGKPVVLLHGFCETYEVWKDLIDELSKNYRVLAPDLPGFGRSPLPNQEITIENIAEKLSLWIKDVVKEPVIIFAHSMGGYITLAFAENHRDQLKAFGLIHSTAHADSPEKKENRLKAAEFVKKNGAEPFIKTLIPSLFHQANEKQALVQEAMKTAITTPAETIISYSLAMRERPPRYHLLSDEEIPKLFIAGKYDEVVPLSSSEEQISKIKNGKGVVLENSAHMGMTEEPGSLLKEIKEFLKNIL